MDSTKPQPHQISVGELARRVGITTMPVSMLDIAEKIGFVERPIPIDRLAIAVAEWEQRQRS